jgi:hypothetical protein
MTLTEQQPPITEPFTMVEEEKQATSIEEKIETMQTEQVEKAVQIAKTSRKSCLHMLTKLVVAAIDLLTLMKTRLETLEDKYKQE